MGTESIFKDEHLILFRTAVGVNKYFGLRRAVTECDVRDTFGAECLGRGHAAPGQDTCMDWEGETYAKKAIIRNNPSVGGYRTAT